MSISLSRPKTRYLDASSSKVLSLCYHLLDSSTSALSTISSGGVPSYRCVGVQNPTRSGRGAGADRHAREYSRSHGSPRRECFSYRRARLEPLNRQGRQDWVDSSMAGTWPWPLGWRDERCTEKSVRRPFWCSDP